MSTNENKELAKIININEDAAEFYGSARDKAENPQIKTTFENLEGLHKGVIVNLQSVVLANGGDVEVDETFAGQTRQFWGELMAKISNDVDETLVANLEEAEDRCLHSIEDIMQDNDISPSVKAALQSEYDALQKSHDYMKALKDNMKNAA